MEGPLLRVPLGPLSFPAEPRNIFTQDVRLKNICSQHVAFRVKTTAPKDFLVKPSSGVVKPGAELLVKVSLLPATHPPTSRPRFLIQAVGTSSSEEQKKDAWEMVYKDSVEEHRLGVQFHETEQNALMAETLQRTKELSRERDELEAEFKACAPDTSDETPKIASDMLMNAMMSHALNAEPGATPPTGAELVDGLLAKLKAHQAANPATS